MTTFAFFRCKKDGKLFKVVSGSQQDGPYLCQYDGDKYNKIKELRVSQRENEMAEGYRTEAVRRGMEIASIHSECAESEFIIEDIDDFVDVGRL